VKTDAASKPAPDAASAATSSPGSDWGALLRLADAIGSALNPVTQVRGIAPPHPVADNGGAQAVCLHDDEFEGVVTSDGVRHALQLT